MFLVVINKMKTYKIFVFTLLSMLAISSNGMAQQNVSFEMRYFTSDPKASGETDFHGETEWMTLEQRVEFLNMYAVYASNFWNDVHFDKKLVSPTEISEKLKNIKPQPLTAVRRTIPLTGWKAYGYKNDHTGIRKHAIAQWESDNPGVKVASGQLIVENTVLTRETEPLNWRFRLRMTLEPVKSAAGSIVLSDNDSRCIHLQFEQGTVRVNGALSNEMRCQPDETVNLEVYGDFANRRFFVTVNGKTSSYAFPKDVSGVNRLEIASSGELRVDDILLFNFIRDEENKFTPYYSSVAIDENFEEKPPVDGWQYMNFDDSGWEPVELPSVHGGEREKEEYYYLRKTLKIEDFERAILKIETVDPGGEVWINGEVVAVVANRHPVKIDVSRHLKRNSDNIIAVRVNHHRISHPMHHSASDQHVGWFLGRAELLLSSRCMIKDLFVHTESLSDKAEQYHQAVIQHSGVNAMEGSLEINYYPWYPSEGDKIATATVENINIRPLVENKIVIRLSVENARLWTAGQPYL